MHLRRLTYVVFPCSAGGDLPHTLLFLVQDVRLQQLYVRLLGLLLDAMFYLTSRKVYERCRTTRDVKRLPLPVKNVVKQTVVKGLPEERRGFVFGIICIIEWNQGKSIRCAPLSLNNIFQRS